MSIESEHSTTNPEEALSLRDKRVDAAHPIQRSEVPRLAPVRLAANAGLTKEVLPHLAQSRQANKTFQTS